MKVLQVINWLLTAAAATMAVTLGVVCLLFFIYREEPIMQASFPELLTQTSMFWGLFIVTGSAALTLHKRITGYWLFQGLMAAAVSGVVYYYLPG